MSIEIMQDHDADRAVLIHKTTGVAFGETFHGTKLADATEVASAFLRWLGPDRQRQLVTHFIRIGHESIRREWEERLRASEAAMPHGGSDASCLPTEGPGGMCIVCLDIEMSRPCGWCDQLIHHKPDCREYLEERAALEEAAALADVRDAVDPASRKS